MVVTKVWIGGQPIGGTILLRKKMTKGTSGKKWQVDLAARQCPLLLHLGPSQDCFMFSAGTHPDFYDDCLMSKPIDGHDKFPLIVDTCVEIRNLIGSFPDFSWLLLLLGQVYKDTTAFKSCRIHSVADGDSGMSGS